MSTNTAALRYCLQVKVWAEITTEDVYLDHTVETGISPSAAIRCLYLHQKVVSFNTEQRALKATTRLLHKDKWRRPLCSGNSRLKNSIRYTGGSRRNLPYSEEGPFIKLYRYNEKYFYPNVADYGKNGEKSFEGWKFSTNYILKRREICSSCTNSPCS
jgi:hypothetical protein